MTIRVLEGDCRAVLATLAPASVHCVLTSPPYFGLRDYGTGRWVGGDPGCDHKAKTRHQIQGATSLRAGRANAEAQRSDTHHRRGGPEAASSSCPRCGAVREDEQIGLEPSVDAYVAEMVAVFREVRRVLRDDGTVWLNLGDSYANDLKWGGYSGAKNGGQLSGGEGFRVKRATGLKPKDLMMIPARVALALQADGWYVRSDVIWSKPSPLPESVLDRPTSAHEHVFLLTKRPTYFYDAEAVREQAQGRNSGNKTRLVGVNRGRSDSHLGASVPYEGVSSRNLRNVWTINAQPQDIEFCTACRRLYSGSSKARVRREKLTAEDGTESVRRWCQCGRHDAWISHFATMPPRLAELCIMAGTSERGCCPTCRTPWQRVVTKGEPLQAQRRASGGDAAGEYHGRSSKGHAAAGVQDASAVKARILDGMRERISTWRQGCDCPPAEPVPCMVLDPFGGAGTTGLVADRLKRDAILIELHPDYAALARTRIAAQSGLFGDVT